MDIKKLLVIFNGFLHDFAAGIWLAAMANIILLHRAHSAHPEITGVINVIERYSFWASVAAMTLIMATGAGRTFTYVENWYGPDAERVRRRMLIVKHVILLACFGTGYLFVYGKVFH
jgi:putative copper export protein